jgi:hypothetical protein
MKDVACAPHGMFETFAPATLVIYGIRPEFFASMTSNHCEIVRVATY